MELVAEEVVVLVEVIDKVREVVAMRVNVFV